MMNSYDILPFMNKYYLLLEAIIREYRSSSYEMERVFGIKGFSVKMAELKKNPDRKLTQKSIADIERALNIKIDDSNPENITYSKISESPAKEHIYSKEDFMENLVPIDVVAYVHAGETGPVFSEEVIETIALPKAPGLSKMHALRVLGDSMAPTINEGDNIVVSLDTQAFDGDVALIAYNNHDYILKRVYFNDDRDIVTIVSDNNKYSPAILHISKIKSILPVVYHARGRNSLRMK